MFANPLRNASVAPLASVSNFCLNSLADIPATFANPSSLSPPLAQAFSNLDSKLLNAVPPASASIPNDDIVPAQAIISASVIPTCLPVPAILNPIVSISDSVVARLLPKLTIVDPNLPTVPVPLPVMLRNLAIPVAASVEDIFVLSPICIAVLVNASKLSAPFTPSCPAISITDAISDADCGISFDRLIQACLSVS